MPRRLPPVWLMGLCNLPFSLSSTVLLITMPQLLAARGVPEPHIASITAFALIPGFGAVLLAPILDVRFSRRSYAIGFAIATALLTSLALQRLDALALLAWLLFAANAAAILYQGAVAGWLTSIVPQADESRLAAWFTVANIGGFGIAASANIVVFRALAAPWGAAAIAALIVLPLLLFLPLPAPGPDRRLAEESFRAFFGDLMALVRRPSVVRTLLVFASPAACFALTNTLGGLGRDFATSEAVVGLVAGIGVTFAGIVGSLAVPRLAARFGAYRLYVAVGLCGAAFTFALLALPATPFTFGLAMVGENIGQAAAFATGNTIIFREIGKDNPLAATEYTVLSAAILLPLSYMQMIDGQAYGAGGLSAALGTDAALGLAGSLLVALLLGRTALHARRAAI